MVGPSGRIPCSGCTVQHLDPLYLALPFLLSPYAARLRVPHAVSVVVRIVYTLWGTRLVDDTSHSVLAHNGDEGVSRCILSLHELLQSGIGTLQSTHSLETVFCTDCNMELLKQALLLL